MSGITTTVTTAGLVFLLYFSLLGLCQSSNDGNFAKLMSSNRKSVLDAERLSVTEDRRNKSLYPPETKDAILNKHNDLRRQVGASDMQYMVGTSVTA